MNQPNKQNGYKKVNEEIPTINKIRAKNRR